MTNTVEVLSISTIIMLMQGKSPTLTTLTLNKVHVGAFISGAFGTVLNSRLLRSVLTILYRRYRDKLRRPLISHIDSYSHGYFQDLLIGVKDDISRTRLGRM